MGRYPRLLVLALVVLLPGLAPAQQVAREVVRTGDSVRFDISFRDAAREQHVLRFSLPADTYRAARDGLEPPDSERVRERINKPLDAYVDKRRAEWRQAIEAHIDELARTLPRHIRVDHRFEDGQLSWSLESRHATQSELERYANRLQRRMARASERLVARTEADVRRYAERVRDEVYGELRYVSDPALEGMLRVDYRQIAREAAPRLSPLAEAIAARAGPDARARTALALSFLQAIPYDELTDRNAADGTGFATPVEMLDINLGDCDSKATALAALMYELAPEVRTAMLLLPGHAVLAAELPPQPGDRIVRLRGSRFVLMEPAGPALVPIGKVAEQSRAALDAGELLTIVWMTG